MTHSTEFYQAFITDAYQSYLGRPPDSPGLAYWTNALQNGTSEQVEAGIVSSSEYLAQHGGPGEGWIESVYHHLLGRDLDESSRAFWNQAVLAGLSSHELAYDVATGFEHEGRRIAAYYQRYLQREPDPNEMTRWANDLLLGVTTHENVVAQFISSHEYFQKQGGNISTWFANIYQALFHVSAAETSSAPTFLPAVANVLTHSAEFYQAFITDAYQSYLGRQPDSPGLAFWTNALQHGTTDEQIEAGIVSSAEYLAQHGGPGEAWIESVYHHLLGREPDGSGRTHWLQALQIGTSTYDIAFQIDTSDEGKGKHVSAYYEHYLGRLPALDEVTYWVNLLRSGATREDVAGSIISSPEAVQKPGGHAQAWFDRTMLTIFIGSGITSPTAAIVAIAPDPRATAVGMVTVDFSEPVTGVDLADFRLSRDGNVVALDGVSFNTTSTVQVTLDLTSVTGTPGSYTLTLVASGSGIQDSAGNVLASDATDNWQITTSLPADSTPPTAIIQTNSSDPQTIPVSWVLVTFSETVGGVDIGDFRLTRDGNSVSLAGLPFEVLSVTQAYLDLTSVVGPPGNYILTLSAAGSGIMDPAGNALVGDASASWQITTFPPPDTTPPVATIVAIAPDPRTAPVGLVTVDFSEPVTGVDLADFRITLNGITVALSSISVNTPSPSQVTLDLTSVTGTPGDYALTLVASNSGIQDLAGNVLASDTSDNWQTNFTPEQFAQQLEQINSEHPLPTTGFALDWTKYSGTTASLHAEDAVFEVANSYQGKPGIDALSLSTLPQLGVEALPEFRRRVSTQLGVLEADIGNLATVFEGQQNTTQGIDTYRTLRGRIVEQATLQFLDRDLGTLEAGRTEEAGRTRGARDIALYSLTPTPSAPSASATPEEQIAVVQSQKEVVLSNLGVLAVAQQTAQDIASAAKFQATTLEATVAAQEIQTVSMSARGTLSAIQATEAELRDIISNPLDHLTWPAASGVEFASGLIPGSFGYLAVSPDQRTLVTNEDTGMVLRDSRTGIAIQTLTVPTSSQRVAAALTADGKVWTLNRDTIALRDPGTGQVIWEWQDIDRNLTVPLAATRDGSLVAVPRLQTIILLRRSGTDVISTNIALPEYVQEGLQFDPSGTLLAVPMQSTLVLLNVGTGERYDFTGFHGSVSATAWSGDGTMVVAGDMTGFAQLIDVPTRQVIGWFQIPSSKHIDALAFSPNQALVLTGTPNEDVGLVFWNITRLDQIEQYANSIGHANLAYFQKSHTGNTLLARSKSGLVAYAMPEAGRGAPISRDAPPILNPVPPTPPPTPDHPAWPQEGKVAGTLGTAVVGNQFSSVSPDGQSFLIPIPGGAAVQIRSVATGKVTQNITIGSVVDSVAITSDGQKLILISSDSQSSTRVLTLRDLGTQADSVLQTFPTAVDLAIDPLHNLAAVVDHIGGSRAKVIDLAAGTAEEIPGTESHSNAIAISMSGQYVAVGLADGRVAVYDRAIKQTRTLTGLLREIKALAWSHGSDALLAAADDNANLALFVPSSTQPLSVFSSPSDSDATTALQFSNNNLLLFRAANANGLLTFDVSNPGSPHVSSELPLLALNAARPLVLSRTGETLLLSALTSIGTPQPFITGVTIPPYGRAPASSPAPTPAPVPPPGVPPLDAARQNELAAPTTVATLNPTQRQYLLDSVTAYFNQRVIEGGIAGIPSFYLRTLENNPDRIGLSADSSYRDYYGQIVGDMREKWLLQTPPQLDALAGGSGTFIPPVDPVAPPVPSPLQVEQQQTVEELILRNLRSPVRLSAGQWVNVVDPSSTTHVGSHKHAIDLSLLGAPNNARPNFDKGQPISAPMHGTILRIDREHGQLVMEHKLTQADDTSVTITSVFFHLKIDDSVSAGMQVSEGRQIGQIWTLTDGTIQSNGESTIDAHLHFEVHLGRETDSSLDLTAWLKQEKIGVLIRNDGIDTGGEGGGSDPRLLTPDAAVRYRTVRYLYDPTRPIPGNLAFPVDEQSLVGRAFLGYLQRFDDADQQGTARDLARALSLVTGISIEKILLASPSGDADMRAKLLRKLFEDGQYRGIFTKANQSVSFTIRDAVVDHPGGNPEQPLGVPYRDADKRVRVRFDLSSDTTIDHISLFIRNAIGQPTPVAYPLVTVYDQFFADLPLSALARAFHAPMNTNFSIEMQAFGGADGKRLLGKSLTTAFRVEIDHPEGFDGVTSFEMNATTFAAWVQQHGTITQRFDNPVTYMRERTIHGGYDIANKVDTPIHAYIGGAVTEIEGTASSTEDWGLSVIITDANGNEHRYAHLNALDSWVTEGVQVASGQVFAYMGHSGNVFSTSGGDGTHLHYEVKDVDDILVDPGR